LALRDQVRDAVREHARFPGTRAGDDEQRSVGRDHGLVLDRVEAAEQIELRSGVGLGTHSAQRTGVRCETPPMRVGVDTGGTFTDLVADDGRAVKVPSTPSDPAVPVVRAIAEPAAGRQELLAHGTTVATNALLQGRGAPVALVT